MGAQHLMTMTVAEEWHCNVLVVGIQRTCNARNKRYTMCPTVLLVDLLLPGARKGKTDEPKHLIAKAMQALLTLYGQRDMHITSVTVGICILLSCHLSLQPDPA